MRVPTGGVERNFVTPTITHLNCNGNNFAKKRIPAHMIVNNESRTEMCMNAQVVNAGANIKKLAIKTGQIAIIAFSDATIRKNGAQSK